MVAKLWQGRRRRSSTRRQTAVKRRSSRRREARGPADIGAINGEEESLGARMKPEDRKKIIKSLKGKIMKLALSDYVCLVLIEELIKQLKELIFDKVKGIPSL